jgi:outer membrane protein assembly factor BamB
MTSPSHRFILRRNIPARSPFCHHAMKAPTTIVLIILAANLTVRAADWPMFRGADRSDISRETGLLKQWPDGGPKKLWVFDKAGLGYSGFSVVGGTLFTMGASDEGEEFVYALDTKDGKPKWKTRVGALLTNNWGDGPRGTPTVDGDRVYALGGKGDLVCVSAKDGKEVWRASMTENGGKVPGWGYTESVLVDGDKVICTPGGGQGTLLALDKMTGKKIWQSDGWTDPAQYASVIAADVKGVHQYIQLTMKSVAGVDANDGKVAWKMDFPGKTAVIPTPIFKDGEVYVSAGYGVGCMKVDISGGNSASQVYANTNMENHHGGVILVGDYLYGYSGRGGWTCQDWKTGDVKWAEKKLGKGAIHCADGMLYLLEEQTGTVVLIEASPDGWKEHGRFKLDPQTALRKPQGKIWTHPVVSDGKLYLRDQDLIFCFNVKG